MPDFETVSWREGVVAILAASATLAGRKTRNRRILSTIVALGLLTSSVTIVHLSGGADEAHFHFFVVLCVLLLYEDGLPYATAFAYVVLDHGTIGVINSQSGGIAHPWRWAAIHVLCITIVSIAGIANWRVNENARREAGAPSRRADVSELRFAVAFDNAPIGVALVAPDGRWLHANQALLNIIGYTREELLKRRISSRSRIRTTSPTISRPCAACRRARSTPTSWRSDTSTSRAA